MHYKAISKWYSNHILIVFGLKPRCAVENKSIDSELEFSSLFSLKWIHWMPSLLIESIIVNDQIPILMVTLRDTVYDMKYARVHLFVNLCPWNHPNQDLPMFSETKIFGVYVNIIACESCFNPILDGYITSLFWCLHPHSTHVDGHGLLSARHLGLKETGPGRNESHRSPPGHRKKTSVVNGSTCSTLQALTCSAQQCAKMRTSHQSCEVQKKWLWIYGCIPKWPSNR